MKNIVIGTAGHIDHGKTTLIKALTGRDTDTLAEEKKRGISIDLGFTYFDLPGNKRAGIIDVPGHEKFIKNMLAGVSGIDIVLLVISAEEGIMPQTVEHLDILNFLNVKKGIVVITKCDNVDKELLDIIKEDISEKIQGTFLENSKVLEVDSISRNGIDELILNIDELSKGIEDNNENLSPRMNIDRIFTVKGFGTVITGTLLEGEISIDDDLIVYPKNLPTKIRNIQVHGENVDRAYSGQRVAINISNIKVDDIKRGDVLAKEGSLEESMMIDVKINLVGHSNKTLKHWDRLRLYHGSREILCRVVPLDLEKIGQGQSGYAQLRLEESIVSKKGDKFVLRNYSPMETIGGGVIIDTIPKKHKRFDDNVIKSLKVKEKGELKSIIESYLKKDLDSYLNIKDIIVYTGDNEASINKAISVLEEEGKLIKINNFLLHIEKYEKLKNKSLEILNDYHKKYRLRKGISKEEFRSRLEPKFKIKDIDKLLENMCDDKIIKIEGSYIFRYEFEPKLNEKQKEIEKEIQSILKKSKLEEILTIDKICKNNYYTEVLEFMIGNSVEKLDDIHVIDKEYYEYLKQHLIEYLNENKEITLSQYRDLLNSSRKNCLIILENFDRNKITKREDNKRILA